MAGRKSYSQNCPIARGLDVLGERWTLLILRELIGGARRYGDVRAALPGIATNLLADRLRELEAAGLIRRNELPPPVARTVYTLSDEGWHKVPPVIRAVATFGLNFLDPSDSALTPLNGFSLPASCSASTQLKRRTVRRLTASKSTFAVSNSRRQGRVWPLLRIRLSSP